MKKKVLIIKTSSLGDVIHTLPALTDAAAALGEVQFDWVVEENFAEIPAWHPSVGKVIPIAMRRWRKNILKTLFSNFRGQGSGEWKRFKQLLQQEHYDAVIDAQGLLKSAWISRLAKGDSYGLDKNSAREPLASYFYQYPQAIDKQQHAVERVRELFAKSLGYSFKELPLDYGITKKLTANALNSPSNSQLQSKLLSNLHSNLKAQLSNSDGDTILFLHGTTWETKHWPESYWFELASRVTESGYTIVLPWGNDSEYQRALRIKQQCNKSKQIVVLEKMTLNELAQQIIDVDAVVAVDTGLAHLSAALDKPTIAIYGPTSPGLTGTYGNHQIHLQVDFACAPCFKKDCNKSHRPINLPTVVLQTSSPANKTVDKFMFDKSRHNISPECYLDMTPERVMNALRKLLNQVKHQ